MMPTVHLTLDLDKICLYGLVGICGFVIFLLFGGSIPTVWLINRYGDRIQAKQKKKFYDHLDNLRIHLKIESEVLKRGEPISEENLEFLKCLVEGQSYDPTPRRISVSRTDKDSYYRHPTED